MHFPSCLRLLVACLLTAPRLFAEQRPTPLHVLTTLAPVHSWTANVAGTNATVECLLPAEIGPHDFQFRPRDLRKIQASDLVVAVGLGLDAWLDKAIQSNLKSGSRPVVRVSDGLDRELIRELPALKIAGSSPSRPPKALAVPPNPHIWLDPRLACHGVSNILAALQRADPAHAAAYASNAATYIVRLKLLDEDFRRALSTGAPRRLVTFHDAFPYLARRYGLELVGVVEEVPAVEPSPRYLKKLIEVIRERDVKVVFVEPQFSPRIVQRLAEDLKLRVGELDVLETGPASATFYEEGMRRNLKVLLELLP